MSRTARNDRSRFIVELEPQASDVPADVRLRHLLKLAWRHLGLKCVGMKQVEPGDIPAGNMGKTAGDGE